MLVRMRASQRELLRDGIDMLEKQTKAAMREETKAYLPTMNTDAKLSAIAVAKEGIPVSEDAQKTWEVLDAVSLVYRDGLASIGVAYEKLRRREDDMEVDTTCTREFLDDIQGMMRALGDQRDLFSMVEQEERRKESGEVKPVKADNKQMELVGAPA
jgi:hypothetical protein